jgi:hypothetical protein
MLARYFNAPLLLLLLQVAPGELHRDHAGRVRYSFGAGHGAFAFRDDPGWPAGGFGCSGGSGARDPYTDKIGYSSRGVAAEVWASQRVRVHAALGGISDFSAERQGTFGAVQAVLEQQHFGFGLGLAASGATRHPLQPSASARVGSLTGLALRADYDFPQAGMGLIGGPRIGVGWNQGPNRKPRIFLGVATTPIPDTARRAGGFIELSLPLGILRSGLAFNGFVSGKYHGNETKKIYSLGFGAWLQP